MAKENIKKEDPEEQDEGRDLCPKCGNLMIREGDDLVCSSCSDDIDFFGEEDAVSGAENES